MKKQIANCITSLRIIGTLCLLFTETFSVTFYVIYTLCGITDLLDGLAARLTKSTSEFGAKLDSVADLFFYAVMIIQAFPSLWDMLPKWVWLIALAAVLVRVVSYLIAAIKHKKFAAMHTYLNKLTGLVVFTVPYFVLWGGLTPVSVAACVIALLAAVEELIIHYRQNSYKSVKSIAKIL